MGNTCQNLTKQLWQNKTNDVYLHNVYRLQNATFLSGECGLPRCLIFFKERSTDSPIYDYLYWHLMLFNKTTDHLIHGIGSRVSACWVYLPSPHLVSFHPLPTPEDMGNQHKVCNGREYMNNWEPPWACRTALRTLPLGADKLFADAFTCSREMQPSESIPLQCVTANFTF